MECSSVLDGGQLGAECREGRNVDRSEGGLLLGRMRLRLLGRGCWRRGKGGGGVGVGGDGEVVGVVVGVRVVVVVGSRGVAVVVVVVVRALHGGGVWAATV